MDVVAFISEIGAIEQMPLEMLDAYVPYQRSFLDLESSARMAHLRDLNAAENLMFSICENAPQLLSILSREGSVEHPDPFPDGSLVR